MGIIIKNYIGRVIRKILNSLSASKDIVDAEIYTKDFFKGYKYVIGDYTYGKPKILFENENANLEIGKYCSIAEEVTVFLGGNHRIDWITTYPFNVFNEELFSVRGKSATKGNVEIGNDVWLGFKTTILSGVKISDGAVIAAGSVVTKDVGPYEIWAGNPAKFVKKRFTEEQILKLLEIQWWNWNDAFLKKKINLLCSDNIDEFLFQADKINNAGLN